jgi:hypothetical protein
VALTDRLDEQRVLQNVLKHPQVGAGGFEPPTSRSRSVRAAELRYAPNDCYYTPFESFDKTQFIL